MCFFFFQAEDGIRDGRVTGVQTCALPISNGVAADVLADIGAGLGAMEDAGHDTSGAIIVVKPTAFYRLVSARDTSGFCFRSEERRVGKECRSRWSPDQ